MITAGAVTEEEKPLRSGQQIVLEGDFCFVFDRDQSGRNLMRRHTMRPRYWWQMYGRAQILAAGGEVQLCGKNCMDSGRYCMTGLQKFFLRRSLRYADIAAWGEGGTGRLEVKGAVSEKQELPIS